MAAITPNDKCYECHAEKRGPFLFEHQPSWVDQRLSASKSRKSCSLGGRPIPCQIKRQKSRSHLHRNVFGLLPSPVEFLKQHGIRISMDGRGRALDNVFVERLWRSVKYEEIYRREYDDLRHLRSCLFDYFEFYNHHRPHSSLGELNPAAFHAAHIRENAQVS